MYATQCVTLDDGCIFTIPIPLENGLSPKYIPTLCNPIQPSTGRIFIFEVSFLNKYLWTKSLNDIVYFI